jgi:sugar phosphate isomerase/epimerase
VFSKVVEGLKELDSYCCGKGVNVLLETHGSFDRRETLEPVFERLDGTAIGILWDIEHAYKAEGETEKFYLHFKKYIRHVHVKDGKRAHNTFTLCPVGEGDIPVRHVVKMLKEGGYDGWLSLEWEKLWQPELAEPEAVLPVYSEYMRKLLQKCSK